MAREAWHVTVVRDSYRVTARERPEREGLVYLYWRERGMRASRALTHGVRTPRGRLDQTLVALARAEAEQKAAALAGDGTGPGLTLRQTETVIFHPLTGQYPVAAGERLSLHHREVQRALRYATGFWGPERTWASLRRTDLRALWRQRIRDLTRQGHDGVRGAEIVVARLLAVARWLQREELIPPEAMQPGAHWKRELREDWRQITGAERNYEPHRPRYSTEEYHAMLDVADQVDPRFGLLVMLAAEQRLGGGARRLKRSDVSRVAAEVRVPSRGKKGGALVLLDASQQAALDRALEGYLARLEQDWLTGQVPDYPLFPQGKLVGWKGEGGSVTGGHRRGHKMVKGALTAPLSAATRPPVSRAAVEGWFRRAEQLAGIPHLPGRGVRAMRRTGVDLAVEAGATPAELEAFGGWSDSQTPQSIYRDRQHRAAAERARDIRSKVRARP